MDQETATAIRRTYHEDSNITMPDLVVMYGVSRAAVKRILRHETWRTEEDRELFPYGEREYQFGVMSNDLAREARREYFETRITMAELAVKYGMSPLSMRRLLRHRTYFSRQDMDDYPYKEKEHKFGTLTKEQVREARREYYETRVTLVDLAVKHGVSLESMRRLLKHRTYFSKQDEKDYPYRSRDFTGRKPLSETDIAQMRQGKWEEGLKYEKLAGWFNYSADTVKKICTYKKYPNLVHESRWSEYVVELTKNPNWADEIGRKMNKSTEVPHMLKKLEQGVPLDHVLSVQLETRKPMEYWLTKWELLYLRLFYMAKDQGTTARALREEAAKINVPKLTVNIEDI